MLFPHPDVNEVTVTPLEATKALVTLDVLHQVSEHSVGGVEDLHRHRAPIEVGPREDEGFRAPSDGMVQGINGT